MMISEAVEYALHAKVRLTDQALPPELFASGRQPVTRTNPF
jgi:hypothetical protein